ncbi:MAG: tetratricopeptide repeat protein [Anaerolineae bacterium]|nr:tetratricopeptide repeat protein [Anaerolineae bacterium]
MVGFLNNARVKNLYERAIEKTRKGDMHGALKDFTEVLKLDSKHADAYFRRGYLLMRNGDLTSAAHDFLHALKLNPNHDNAPMMKEVLKRAKDMLTRSAPPATTVAASAPAAPLVAPPPPAPAPEPPSTLAAPVTPADQGFVDSQISLVPEMASAAEEAEPPSVVTPQMFIDRGIELYEADQVEEAIDTFIEALKIDPDNADAYINLGAIYHHFDEDELAHEYFKTALALAPNHPDAGRMRELLRVTEEATRTRRGLMAAENANTDVVDDSAGEDDLPVVPQE